MRLGILLMMFNTRRELMSLDQPCVAVDSS